MKCPYCGEEIKDTAKKCRFCGEWLEEPQNIPNSEVINNTVCEEDILLKRDWQATIVYVVMIFMISFVFMQILWLVSLIPQKDNKKSKESVYKILNKLTYNEYDKISGTTVWLLFSVTLIIAILNTIAIFTHDSDFGAIVGLCAIANYIVLGIFLQKAATLIEEYLSRIYNTEIQCNRILVFLFQAIYLNYFIRSYRKNIRKR